MRVRIWRRHRGGSLRVSPAARPAVPPAAIGDRVAGTVRSCEGVRVTVSGGSRSWPRWLHWPAAGRATRPSPRPRKPRRPPRRHGARDRPHPHRRRRSAAQRRRPPIRARSNLAAPEIAKAVSDLPRDPRSGQPWSPEPLAGNYNECAPLSAVDHQGQHQRRQPEHPRGAVPPRQVHPDRRAGHLRLQRHRRRPRRTGDTVALMYSNGTPRPRERGAVPLERQRRRADRQHAARPLAAG